MIYINGNEPKSFYVGDKSVDKIYKCNQLIWSGSELPNGYKKCTYITKYSGNISCIALDYVLKNTHDYVITITLSDIQHINGDQNAIVSYFKNDGIMTGINTNREGNYVRINPTQWSIRVEGYYKFYAGQIYTITASASKSNVYVAVNGDTLKSGTCDVDGNYEGEHLYIYSMNSGQKNVSNYKLYSLSIFDNQENKDYKYIPCLNTQGKIGLYSTATSTFIEAPNDSFTYELA